MRRFVVSTWKIRALCALVPLLLALAGCGGGGLAGPTGTVTGKVTHNGQPVPAGCSVTFIHQETSTPASGLISADGSYALTMRGEKRVLAGEYKVSVSPPASNEQVDENSEGYEATMTGGGAATTVTVPFPDKYLLAETSGLTFTVKEGSNTFDVKMDD